MKRPPWRWRLRVLWLYALLGVLRAVWPPEARPRLETLAETVARLDALSQGDTGAMLA